MYTLKDYVNDSCRNLMFFVKYGSLEVASYSDRFYDFYWEFQDTEVSYIQVHEYHDIVVLKL